jgi:hypothetical protein
MPVHNSVTATPVAPGSPAAVNSSAAIASWTPSPPTVNGARLPSVTVVYSTTQNATGASSPIRPPR